MFAPWVALVVATAPNFSVDGGLPLAQVRDVIDWHAGEINACLSGTRLGSVRYRFGVEADGRVKRIAFIEAQKAEAARVTCVGTAVEKWRFPATDAGTALEWNFSVSSIDAGVATDEELAPDDLEPRWVDDATDCYETLDEEQPQGRLTLDLVVGGSGAVFEATVSDTSPSVAATKLADCLSSRALSWSLPAGSLRHVRTNWVFAATESRAKLLFVPSAPAREIISAQPTLAQSGGGLEKDVIRAVLRRASPHIHSCYELALQAGPYGGKVSVAFRIGPDGHVAASEVAEDTLDYPPTNACILHVVDRLEFPRPHGGGSVNVTFPWIFKAAGKD